MFLCFGLIPNKLLQLASSVKMYRERFPLLDPLVRQSALPSLTPGAMSCGSGRARCRGYRPGSGGRRSLVLVSALCRGERRWLGRRAELGRFPLEISRPLDLEEMDP